MVNVEVTPQQETFLDHKSYLDTGQVFEIPKARVRKAVQGGKFWQLSDETRGRIKTAVKFHGVLIQEYEKIVLDSF